MTKKARDAAPSIGNVVKEEMMMESAEYGESLEDGKK